jgi:hypothetical protein
MVARTYLLKRCMAFVLCAVTFKAAAHSLENVEYLLFANNGKIITLPYRSTSSDEAAGNYFYGNKAVSNFAFCYTTESEMKCSSSRNGGALRRYKVWPGDATDHPDAKAIWFKEPRSLRPLRAFICEQGCGSDRFKTILEVSTEP